MRLVDTSSLDVYFNLAAESYFLHQTNETIFMLWRSENAVVCGKHQNICAEINIDYCKRNGILPARRISGGGTVFHDRGNVNFTFIQPLKDGLEKAVDYKQFLEPVRSVLRGMGIETEYSVRHDLLYKGIKISGNAQHIYQQGKRVLHHGTLLFNTQLESLGDALHAEGVYQDKAVKSNRSSVTNLGDHYSQYRNMDQVLKSLWDGFSVFFGHSRAGISELECNEIITLRQEKFSQDSWIFGYSPSFSVVKEIETPEFGTVNWSWEIQKGLIASVMVTARDGIVLSNEAQLMVGKPYWSSEVRDILGNYSLSQDAYFYRLF
jgi:lipoate-protein ligase A